MRVAFVQMKPEFGRVKDNVARVVFLMKREHADLYVLPELFNTGYLFTSKKELDGLAENAKTGYTFRTLSDFAREKNAAIVYGFAEKTDDGIYNSSCFVDDKSGFKLYRKLHLFLNEKNYFLPGNLPLDVFSYRDVNLGMMICFDWIFPEVTRCLALMGADIVCHPANLVMKYCQEAMRTRSLENTVFTVTANRIGEETRGKDSFKFTGSSQITDCKGNVLYRAGDDKEESFSADINIKEARNKNINVLNNLWHDRRMEFYKRLGES